MRVTWVTLLIIFVNCEYPILFKSIFQSIQQFVKIVEIVMNVAMQYMVVV